MCFSQRNIITISPFYKGKQARGYKSLAHL
jgi:hypothetical protein